MAKVTKEENKLDLLCDDLFLIWISSYIPKERSLNKSVYLAVLRMFREKEKSRGKK